jgi:hypothetical protein
MLFYVSFHVKWVTTAWRPQVANAEDGLQTRRAGLTANVQADTSPNTGHPSNTIFFVLRIVTYVLVKVFLRADMKSN